MALKFGTNGNDWIFGSDDRDQIFGLGGQDLLFGFGGDDSIWGDDGADYLSGGAGNDLLDGGSGGDVLVGGPGSDAVSYYGSPVGVWVSLYGNFAHYGDAEGDKLSEIETIWGSHYSDYLAGDDSVNGLWGREGNDILVGYGGSDFLLGDSGDDTLYGGSGTDTLNGDSGNDRLFGGMDSDTMYGGSGADMLYGGMGPDTMYGGTGADTFSWTDTAEAGVLDAVNDFNRSEGDLIDLSAIDPNPSGWGNEAFAFIGTAAFSGVPGEIRYYHDSTDTFILLQTDTSTDAEGIIRLQGHQTPDASWFVL